MCIGNISPFLYIYIYLHILFGVNKKEKMKIRQLANGKVTKLKRVALFKAGQV